jgi:hypothetical protein
MMSERESVEVMKFGDVWRWSSDSETEQFKDKSEATTFQSDTTGSTSDIFKSPDRGDSRVPGLETTTTDVVSSCVIQARNKFTYTGVTHVDETEKQATSSDSEDDIPVARLLRPKKTVCSLTLQQIQDCKEGPQGEKAVGVTVAKLFDGVEFRGEVDRFQTSQTKILLSCYIFTKRNCFRLSYVMVIYLVFQKR